MIEQGLLTEADLKGVDFGQDPTKWIIKVFEQRRPCLKAVMNFFKIKGSKRIPRILADAFWLELFAEYILKNTLIWKLGQRPDAIRAREPKALAKYREELADNWSTIV